MITMPIRSKRRNEEKRMGNSIRQLTLLSDGKGLPKETYERPFSFEGIIFSVCVEGTAKVRINFKEYIVVPNSIITVFPNEVVQLLDCSGEFQLNVLAFSSDYLADIISTEKFNFFRELISVPVLRSVAEDEIKNILNYYTFIVGNSNRKQHLFSKQIIGGLLYSLLMEVAAKYSKKDALIEERLQMNRSEEITEQFLQLLKEHHKQERSASFYANKLCITTKYLSGVLKKVTGRSINSWLEDAIITSSKRLLKSSNYTVLQISEKLNFPNPSYFGRFFKKRTGMTPKEYRNMK